MARHLATLALLVSGLTAAAAPNLKGKGEPLYYPTKEGDKLVYEMQSPVATSMEITEVVTKVEKKDGALIVSVERNMGGKTALPSQFSVSEKGVTRIATSGRDLPVPIPLLNLTTKPGDTWTYEPDTGGGGGPARITTYRMGREEMVEVPAGKFKALRVESEQQLGANVYKATLWYAPGVGLVKSVSISGDTERTQVLKSFTPGK
jgi:DUF3108-like